MIRTIGHSTRAISELVGLLAAHEVVEVVDVRRSPASRRHPQFDAEALRVALAEAGITYRHEPDLGGRRSPRRDSANMGWRSAGLRGYADYMATAAFQRALERFVEFARTGPTAILCAEALPWRCHRQLIADALVARGESVGHILGTRRLEPYRLAPQARVLPTVGCATPVAPPTSGRCGSAPRALSSPPTHGPRGGY